jgi:hypothetical protein
MYACFRCNTRRSFPDPNAASPVPGLMPDISEKEGSSTDDEEDGEENENDAMQERTLS